SSCAVARVLPRSPGRLPGGSILRCLFAAGGAEPGFAMAAFAVVYRPARAPHRSAPLHVRSMHGLFFYIGLGLGLAIACGMRPYLPLLLAGALAAHRDAWWPGLVAGAAAAALARAAVGPIVSGARSRLPDRAAREALTVYLDGAALALATLVALLHLLGYVAAALAMLL